MRPPLLGFPFIVLIVVVAAAGCGGDKKDSPAATPPPAAATPPPAAAPAPAPASASPPAASAPAVAQPIASTDIDTPTPLTMKSIAGTGLKQRVSYFYGFAADAGRITLTGTGKNAPSASSTALAASVLTSNADRLCQINLGNTTADKKESAACDVEKAQPLVLRIDLDEDTIDFTVALEGPVRLAAEGAATAAVAAAAGAGSTDIDAPTRLTGPLVKGSGTQQQTSYYYALNAGPGEVRLIGDGKNAAAAAADALEVRLLTLRNEEICRVSLGNVPRGDRKVTACNLDARAPVILRVDLDPNTIEWRTRVEGAVDFEPYTPPATITIALNERVLFDSGKSVLKPESRQTLREAAARVKKFGGAVTIAGHTDNVGSDAANLTLSQARASAVRDFFVNEEAIPADRLEVKAFGKSQPVADNRTPEGRARNRRVEVVISRR